ALYSDAGRQLHKNGALFILPQKIDPQNLVRPQEKTERTGFDLTDQGYGLNRSQGEAHYCIFCHKQKKDSCRTGLRIGQQSRFREPDLQHFQDPHRRRIKTYGEERKLENAAEMAAEGRDCWPILHEHKGCPLDQKISEMNLLKSQGFSVAALAVACVDNPMLAGTGHRICNDCMKSCIFQKQDPVDIPQVETRVLKDVLSLPYGFEIYSLLTRWNPLAEKKLPLPNTGKKILVCGLGPAGYTLAHYLLNDGHEVVAIDGLKIEPLPEKLLNEPIKFVDDIFEPLSKRVIQGFGGVAEYGITARWEKNYLTLIRLLLERRKSFSMFGGIRFGSSITEKIAFEKYGFNHVALCIGAGRPNIINLKNNFAKGVRSASDFLMALQLGGASKEELFTDLQIRMPSVVIGGGLTAVDTACEVQAYYKVQVKKFAERIALIGKEKIWPLLSEEEKQIAEEFLQPQDFPPVKILYRKKLQDSPAYRLNHQELTKAFGQGIEFVENITPTEVEIDKFNQAKALICNDGKRLECKTILIAAGTHPNVAPVLEDGLDLPLAGGYFKPTQPGSVLIKEGVSFFGDLHPDFEGNVVKAMASAKNGSREITNEVSRKSVVGSRRSVVEDFPVRIKKVELLSDHVFQVFVQAPLLAQQTEVGHIFRLQNYHALAPKIGNQVMVMEGVPVTALSVDRKHGIISGIVVDTGGSSHLIKNFKPGEPCVFMGPSGKPTEIPHNETVLLIGGGRGNQPLIAIAEAMSAKGCHVIFFAGYRKNSFVVEEERMKKSCAKLVISINDEPASSSRLQGSVTDAIKQHFFTPNPFPKLDRIFTIGNNHLMHEVARLRHEIPALQSAPIAITSLNAPMQCMLKGVCSQCLQKRKSESGKWEYFYSCAAQDQDMDGLDFTHLHNRCEQNSLLEKVSRLWIKQLEQGGE
ncbi:MAG: pyridine nucleotide-disulfide oxidoreductase, partial [Alphaproteobacteria bacterium]|nr:pyridine nucleotide-disulfide oxidoreductase [Alphaproteobacteria bacterium]